MVTIQDLENSLDEIVTLYTLIKPEELSSAIVKLIITIPLFIKAHYINLLKIFR